MDTASRRGHRTTNIVQEAIIGKPNANGLALIVSNDYSSTRIASLTATSNDARLLKASLVELNYTVVYKHNIRRMDLLSLLDDVTSMTFPCNFKRLVFAFSGHGTDGSNIVMQDGASVNIAFVVAKFLPVNKPHLCSIPKLFFIDACRGQRVDAGVTFVKYDQVAAPLVARGAKALETVRYPSEGNFLIAYSTTAGYEAYEFTARGGLWMSVLAKKLLSEDKSVVDVLTDVNQELIYMYRKRWDGSLQQPELLSRLNETVNLFREAKGEE